MFCPNSNCVVRKDLAILTEVVPYYLTHSKKTFEWNVTECTEERLPKIRAFLGFEPEKGDGCRPNE